jgi:hypothetical protein
MHSIRGLYHLQNFAGIVYNQDPKIIKEISIPTAIVKCSDIEKILEFSNLEKIQIGYTEKGFVEEFTKYIDYFDNLYDIFIDTGDRSLYSFKIITENLIYISGIFKCINKCNSTEQKCYYCENMDYLNTTSSPYCIINNIGNFNLLNNLSPNIKNLKINVGWVNFDKFELSNLPIFIEKLTIIYTNFIAPEKFYELCINKIKLPFKCKLKIIRHVDMNEVTTQNRFFQLE